MNNKIKALIIFSMLIAMTVPVHALSFGSYAKNSEISLHAGGSGSFKILFYTRDDAPIKFVLSVDKPTNFIVNYPEMIELNSDSSDNQYILIDNEYVNVKSVDVRVSIPSNAETGEYKILLKTSSFSQDAQQNSLNVNAEKTFLLKVNVLSGPAPVKETGNEVESPTNEDIPVDAVKNENSVSSENYVSPPSGMAAAENNTFLWAIILVIIVLVSYLIYRKI
jgi:hypothetical protein